MAKREEIRIQTWREHFSAWQYSKKTAQAWCKEQQIPYTTFQSWRRRFEKEAPQSKGFIELNDVKPQHTGLVLWKGDWRIEVDADFDESTLSRVLRVLGVRS
jgi:hypothetical protein